MDTGTGQLTLFIQTASMIHQEKLITTYFCLQCITIEKKVKEKYKVYLEFIMLRIDLASVAGVIMQLYLLTKLFRTATGQIGRNNTYRSNEASTITILRSPLACQYRGTTTCLSSLLVFLL